MKMRKKKHLKKRINHFPWYPDWNKEFLNYTPMTSAKILECINRIIEELRQDLEGRINGN